MQFAPTQQWSATYTPVLFGQDHDPVRDEFLRSRRTRETHFRKSFGKVEPPESENADFYSRFHSRHDRSDDRAPAVTVISHLLGIRLTLSPA